jgi:hypothetical protein
MDHCPGALPADRGVLAAEAVLTIKVAAMQNGAAVVQDSEAPASAPISWEGTQVTRANKGENFSF